jgi:hypothetical protein
MQVALKLGAREKGRTAMQRMLLVIAGGIIMGLLPAGPVAAKKDGEPAIVCNPNPQLGVAPGNPGQVIQDLRDSPVVQEALGPDSTPPEIADLAGYDSVGDAITTDCTTPGRP